MRRREVEKIKLLKSVQDENAKKKKKNHCFTASRKCHRGINLQWGSRCHH